MKRFVLGVVAVGAATAMLVSSAGVGAAATPKSWMLSANGSVPSGLAAKVQAAGGTLTNTIPQVGLAFATSSDASFASKAAKIEGVDSVATNLSVDWLSREPVRAKLRTRIRRGLAMFHVVPEEEKEAPDLVLRQMETFAAQWAPGTK